MVMLSVPHLFGHGDSYLSFSAFSYTSKYTLEQGVQPRPITLAFGKWRQEYQEFKITLDYIAKLMPSYVI